MARNIAIIQNKTANLDRRIAADLTDARELIAIFSALLTSLTAVPVAEADNASTEPAVSQTHLAEASLSSGAALTIERRGPVALFQTEEPRWPTKQPR